jgi:hypothetical protein
MVQAARRSNDEPNKAFTEGHEEVSTDNHIPINREEGVDHLGSERIESLKYSGGLRPDTQLSTEKQNDEPNLPGLEAVESRSSQLPLSKARTIALVVTLTGAAFLNTLSVQASIIILPTIGRELDIAPAGQQWIVSSYSLAFGCFLLL